jgi:hypothetical protein
MRGDNISLYARKYIDELEKKADAISAVNEPETTDEEIEKWVDERIDKVYIGYVSRGLRESMIDTAKWMRNKLTGGGKI